MNAIPPFDLGTLPPAAMDEVGRLLATIAPWRLPLFRAARAGTIALIEVDREAPLPKRPIEAIRKPAVVVIGDDDGLSTGPAGWRCLNAAVRWPRAAIVHSTGGTVAHYEMVVVAACLCRRLLFIETDSEHGAAWRSALERRRVPGLAIVPPTGTLHPAPLSAGVVN